MLASVMTATVTMMVENGLGVPQPTLSGPQVVQFQKVVSFLRFRVVSQNRNRLQFSSMGMRRNSCTSPSFVLPNYRQ
jgi:hypothetical protein